MIGVLAIAGGKMPTRFGKMLTAAAFTLVNMDAENATGTTVISTGESTDVSNDYDTVTNGEERNGSLNLWELLAA